MRCPLADRKAAFQQIEKMGVLGQELGAQWREAHAAAARGDFPAAMSGATRLLELRTQPCQPGFELEDIQLFIGDLHRDQAQPLKAREWYERAEAFSSQPTKKTEARARLQRLPAPPHAWPLQARFGGRKVAQICLRRKAGEAAAAFTDLSGIMAQEWRAAQLDSVDISTRPLKGDFESAEQIQAACGEARKENARVLAAFMLTVDVSRQGASRQVMGVAMPAPDADIRMYVADVDSGLVVYAGSFKDVTQGQADSRLAARLASIILKKYLVPKCPALGGE